MLSHIKILMNETESVTEKLAALNNVMGLLALVDFISVELYIQSQKHMKDCCYSGDNSLPVNPCP
jgi:hypothetical protein